MTDQIKICYITDRSDTNFPMLEAVEEALEAGFTAVQLREKDLSPRELFELALEVKPIVKKRGAALIINSSVDVALAVEADGVHLSYTALPVEAARRVMPKGTLVGLSAHTLEEALLAQRGGADYISLSPIFQTPSKRGIVPTLGLDGLHAVVEQLAIPVQALGGLTAESARECIDAGAHGVSVKSLAFTGKDFPAAAREIVAAVNGRG